MVSKPVALLVISLLLDARSPESSPRREVADTVQEFTTGAVLLTTGDTLHGPVRLYQELDMISLAGPDQATRAFAAGQVALFAGQGGRLVSELVKPNAAITAARILEANAPPARQGRYFYRPFTSPVAPWNQVAQSLDNGRRAAQQLAPETVRLFRTFLWNHDNERTRRLTPAFFEQLTNGPYLLLRRQRLEVATIAADQPAHFAPPVLVDHFYLADSAGQVLRLPQPKQNLMQLLGPQGAALQAYANQHQLRFDNAAQLGVLVTYVNATLVAKR